MKSVLISIQPKRCELIAIGKKTADVRRTRPKLETPFKCYIYKTMSGKYGCDRTCPYFERNQFYSDCRDYDCDRKWGRGKVIGEFVCDKIGQLKFDDDGDILFEQCLVGGYPCLTLGELQSYIGVNNIGYAWHISDLKIYDKPKELGEFRKPCDWVYDCNTCKRALYEHKTNSFYSAKEFAGCDNVITRAPQSWCYVEEL